MKWHWFFVSLMAFVVLNLMQNFFYVGENVTHNTFNDVHVLLNSFLIFSPNKFSFATIIFEKVVDFTRITKKFENNCSNESL